MSDKVERLAERLIVFTRYPQPGTTKTRLIPALGAEAAAALQRQMTEHTLKRLSALLYSRSLTIEIRFAGGDAAQLREWLGDRYRYNPQGTGDLGDRLRNAVKAAFDEGCDRVAVIGTDCPDINASLLDKAFEQLESCDVVLGPAADGGYYLIGLNRSIPELFDGIEWSTERVLSQTLEIAESLDCAIALLPRLSDVDRPEDLAIWESVQRRKVEFISIIIPTLNEAAQIRACLEAAKGNAVEMIVVDAGSTDGTAEIAREMGAIVLQTAPGRAEQMNLGAAVAEGNILLFLHADTQLPPNYERDVRQLLTQETVRQENIVAGAFELRIRSDRPLLRLVELGVNWRSRYLQMPYGDQALFLRAEVFRAIGGFPSLPIMEDFVMVKRLRQRGKIGVLPAPVMTSARRWEKLGVIRTTVVNQLMIIGHFLGIPLSRLAHWYRKME